MLVEELQTRKYDPDSETYSDEDEKVSGGRNGYSAKHCNIFSTKFDLKTKSS